MSDSGDPKQDKQREIEAEREFYESNTDGTKDSNASYNRDVRSEIEQLFLDRILLIDQVNHIGFGGSDDEREAFVLLGTPAQLLEAINQLLDRVRISELEWARGVVWNESTFEFKTSAGVLKDEIDERIAHTRATKEERNR